MKQLTCIRCTHKWYQRRPVLPKICPKCKRENWNRLRYAKRTALKEPA